MGSTYPVIFYSFACSSSFLIRNCFLGLVTISCTVCFIITLCPRFDKPKYRSFRGYMYIILGLSAAFPLIFIEAAKNKNKAILSTGVSL
jgi:adiponectin receptor